MLYTGDEMGYLIKWNVGAIIKKLELCKPKELSEESLDENGKKIVGKAAFSLTQPEVHENV
jgi:hypothetical protein